MEFWRTTTCDLHDFGFELCRMLTQEFAFSGNYRSKSNRTGGGNPIMP
jgi:hypothetical protein